MIFIFHLLQSLLQHMMASFKGNNVDFSGMGENRRNESYLFTDVLCVSISVPYLGYATQELNMFLLTQKVLNFVIYISTYFVNHLVS